MASVREDDAPTSPDAPAAAMDAEEDESPAGCINPLLLASAHFGSWKALNFLLEREDARRPLMMIPTQEFLNLLDGGDDAMGRTVMSAGGDEEEGADHEPALPAAGELLKGVTPDGSTALHAVAGNRDDGDDSLKYASIICDRDRELLFAKNRMGDTPLHCAVRAGRYNMVSHLIALAEQHEGDDGKLKLLRMENGRHETALHDAVRIEDGRVLDDLYRQALLTDANGAAEEKNMVKLLMDADPELANYPAQGISPLCLAILLKKDTIAVTLYKKSGGNLSYSGPDGQNALHVAVLRYSNTVIIEELLKWNKSLTTQVDKHGSTPLHFASSLYPPFGFCWCLPRVRNYRHARIYNIVAEVYEANPAALYQADNSGLFPIQVAVFIGTIDFLLQKSPSSAALRNARGRTFLHVAVEKRRQHIVSFVCQNPSVEWILNMQDKDGNTALHLAIERRELTMCSALLGNKKVHLNLSNVRGNSPLDLSASNLPRGMSYAMISENQIHMALKLSGAKFSSLRWDHINEKYGRPLNKKEKKKQSDLIRDATQMYIIGAVLIATVAFGVTFAVPGGYKADDHLNGGTPTLAGSSFDEFMVANTLAFVCSTVATLGFIISGTTMLDLDIRQSNFAKAEFLLSSSVTSMTVAFGLAAYMVLAPVARSTAIAISIVSWPIAMLYRNQERVSKWRILVRPLFVRRGPMPAMRHFALVSFNLMMREYWPLIVTAAWAVFTRIIHR